MVRGVTTTAADPAAPRTLAYLPLEDIPEALRNPREHQSLAGVVKSIRRFGFTSPLLVDERTGRLVAGHGRRLALMQMQQDGDDPPEGVQQDEGGRWLAPVITGWASRSDAEAEALIVADNRLTELGGWDSRVLTELLEELLDTSPDLLEATGYDVDDVDRMLAEFDADPVPSDGVDSGDTETPAKGDLLALAASTVGEPDHKVATGEVWRLGRHALVVMDVHTGWHQWAPLLTGNALFWPYPTLLAPFAQEAQDREVIMVQPNLYLAGWVLTKWARITGQDPVRVSP
jgi:hypothetical protein